MKTLLWIPAITLVLSVVYSIRLAFIQYRSMKLHGDKLDLGNGWFIKMLIIQVLKTIAACYLVGLIFAENHENSPAFENPNQKRQIYIQEKNQISGQASRNQKYADKVLTIFYDQSFDYENKVKPYFLMPPTEQNRMQAFTLWTESLNHMVKKLTLVNDDSINKELISLKAQIIGLSVSLKSILDVRSQEFDMNRIIQISDSLGETQLMFEKSASNLGLTILSTGNY